MLIEEAKMTELVELLDRINDPTVRQWADWLTLLGISGGLVFTIWLFGWVLRDLGRTLFRHPNVKMGGHREAETEISDLSIVMLGVLAGVAVGTVLYLIAN
jgi:hypothetical protein